MIVSPRAKPITDIVRIVNRERIVEINEVFLYRRANQNSPYQKISYWKRGEDNTSVGSGSGGSGSGGSCDCVQTPCVLLAEADYDVTTSTFNTAVVLLDSEGNPTGGTLQLDHIIETNHE